MRAMWLAVLLLVCVACGGVARASDALYHATVPVADTTSAARNQAIVQAAAAVLARLSGNPRVMALPGVAAALGDAPALVNDYRYTRGPAGALMLEVGFDPQALLGLARQLALSIWPAPRPPVLAEISINGQALDAATATPLLAAGAARGVEFVLPRAGAPAATALLAAAPAALDALARQYRTGLALIGNITPSGGNWTLVMGASSKTWQAPPGNMADVLVAAGNTAADRLLARFAAAPGVASGAPEHLWVGHLRDAKDYAALMALLRRDPRIREALPMQASGNSLMLALRLDAPLTTVAADLAASGHLVNAAAQPGADVTLDWVR